MVWLARSYRLFAWRKLIRRDFVCDGFVFELSMLKSPSTIGYNLSLCASCTQCITFVCVSFLRAILLEERYTDMILNLKSFLKKISMPIAPPL